VHHIWPLLARAFNVSALCGSCHSSIPLPNPFIVPGGRFREPYYWDTWWIVKGLLVSNMSQTVRGMLDNFAYLVRTYGFVPNGARVYYAGRSQPPVFTLMVASYVEATEDTQRLDEYLPLLDREHRFWETFGVSPVDTALSAYQAQTEFPRPESYREDVATWQSSRRPAVTMYSNLAAGAETGWDYSSRWFSDGWNITSIDVLSITPVDLNVFLLLVEEKLHMWYERNPATAAMAQKYSTRIKLRADAMLSQLVVPTRGVFRDKWANGSHTTNWYPAYLLPLLSPTLRSRLTATQAAAMLKEAPLLAGGIPTSLLRSGQQWDYPNAWPPLQLLTIECIEAAIAEYNLSSEFSAFGRNLTQWWVNSNYCGYKNSSLMFEKYKADAPGVPGHGGEYVVQSGFGWTNGVILILLQKYGSWLTAPHRCPT